MLNSSSRQAFGYVNTIFHEDLYVLIPILHGCSPVPGVYNRVKIWFDYGWTNPADGCEDVETSKSSAFANSGQCCQSPTLADISCSVAMWEIELIVEFPGYARHCLQRTMSNTAFHDTLFQQGFRPRFSGKIMEHSTVFSTSPLGISLGNCQIQCIFSFHVVLLCEISEYARIDRIPNMHECSILGQQRLQHRCGTWIDWKILGEWIWTRFKVVVRGPRRNIHQLRNKAFFSIFPRDFRGHSPHFEHPISLMIIMLGAEN